MWPFGAGLVCVLVGLCVRIAGPVGLGTCCLGLAGVGVTSECPAGLMQQAVMVSAHQNEIVHCGGAAVVAGDDVVEVAPMPWPVTATELAVPIAGSDGPPLVGGDVCDW